METLQLKFKGNDDWDRKVYQDQKGRFYKTYEETPAAENLYTAADFYGEPSMPLRKDIKLAVV